MDEIALKVYRGLAIVVVIATGIYFWWEISNSYDWFYYLLYTPTFDIGKVLIALSFCLALGTLLEYDVDEISDGCGIAITLLLLYTFLIDPSYEYVPRGICVWLFYIFLGGSLSSLLFSCVESLDLTIEDWRYGTDSSSSDVAVQPTKSINGHDALLLDIARDAIESRNVSTSHIQRKYEVGFNRAGRIMMQLEKAGIISKQIGTAPREILLKSVEELDDIDFKVIFKKEDEYEEA